MTEGVSRRVVPRDLGAMPPQADAAAGQEAFSRTLAHNLKGPLNSIVSMSGLLRAKAAHRLEPAELRCLDLIERSSREMASLINDLLTLSRIGPTVPDLAMVDLAPMVHAEFEQLRTLHPRRHVVISLPEALPMFCDAALMHAAIQSLVSNAWKFTASRDTARITVALTNSEHVSTLTVQDNGVGFPASRLGEVFEPFQRFHAPGDFPGNGLGLVVCQRIVQRHGGRMSIHSSPGHGTEVELHLPRAHDRPAAPTP